MRVKQTILRRDLGALAVSVYRRFLAYAQSLHLYNSSRRVPVFCFFFFLSLESSQCLFWVPRSLDMFEVCSLQCTSTFFTILQFS